jgi:hypothetical protein
MVHIDPETLRRRPIVGVLLGTAAAAMVGWLCYAGWPEMRLLLGQRTPDRVSIHDAVNQRQARWVTISEGRWFCDHQVTLERRMGPERWVLGKVDETEVPIAGPTVGELLVASFDGELKCESRVHTPLTGVIGSREIFGSRGALRRWSRSAEHVAILKVDASPRTALMMFFGLSAIGLLGLGFAGYYLRLMLRGRERRSETMPAMAPIEPR